MIYTFIILGLKYIPLQSHIQLRSYLMSVTDHCYINVRLSVSLHLWNDNLGRECVFGVGQQMIKQADAAHNLSHFFHLFELKLV